MKLEFTLRQHTPMIHFQSDQAGATLRATELKPKLDRYLIEKTFHNNYEECKRYLVGYTNKNENALRKKYEEEGFRALDYKVSITELQPVSPDIIKAIEDVERIKYKPDKTPMLKKGKPDRFTYPCFFGNMGENDRKLFSIYDTVKLRITSFYPYIIEILENNICEFFAITNFGTRQSKGFGSFYLHEHDALYKPVSSKWHFKVDISEPEFDKFRPVPNGEYYQPYRDLEYYKLNYLFKAIALLYSTIRSGYNYGGLYFKSLMFMYAKQLDPPQQWDKRTLRESLYSDHETYKEVKRKRTDPNGTVQYNGGMQSKLLFRDLLGLSTEQDWMKYGAKKTDKNGNTYYDADKMVKKEIGNEIARFRSPITFKPIRENGTDKFIVHIFANKIPEEYLGKTFIAKSTTWNTSVNLTIPTDFDINSYLEFCFKAVFKDSNAFKKHIDNNVSDKKAKLLMSIYDELRKQ
ncbi:MAG: hypothetical protein WAV76_08680 [Bacteroidota bacterium]